MPTSTKRNTEIAIIGAGTLASALAISLRRCGFTISEIISRGNRESLRRAYSLAKQVGAQARKARDAKFDAKLIWVCVPDDSIGDVVQEIASRTWSRRVVVHSSGALGSDVLSPLKGMGAEIASAHPLMTFVRSVVRDLRGVPFAMEGDAKALAMVEGVVRRLGGKPFRISRDLKAAYHAFGFFCAPAIVTLIAAAQQVGKLAGFNKRRARALMEPIVHQTIENCFQTTPQNAFSGPLRRGDVSTVRKHLAVLQQQPELLELYRALGRTALQQLPVAEAAALKKLLS